MDQQLLITYFQSYYKTLLLFALSYTHDKAEAEDLVLQAYLKAIISYQEGNFKAWMYKVIRNDYYNYYKKQKRVLLTEDEQLSWHQANVDVVEEFIVGEKKQWLFQEILKLPNRQKQVMLLSAFQDISDEEIATILNLTVENVRVIKHRTRTKLMERYKEEWS